jgi:hypothetical protein
MKEDKLKWYSEAGHFAAVCENLQGGARVMPRYFSSDTEGNIFLSAGCVCLSEWDGAIDLMIRDLQELKKRGPQIMREYEADYGTGFEKLFGKQKGGPKTTSSKTAKEK